jgi:hypothetical protein
MRSAGRAVDDVMVITGLLAPIIGIGAAPSSLCPASCVSRDSRRAVRSSWSSSVSRRPAARSCTSGTARWIRSSSTRILVLCATA